VARDVQADNPGVMTIGIGAGQGTAGQVLVLHDMLNFTRGKLPRFVRNFAAEGGSADDAVRRYVAAVKDGSFPDESVHAY
jgi:3-methyl-2-oxobutanoate hydroxymethyltransferase